LTGGGWLARRLLDETRRHRSLLAIFAVAFAALAFCAGGYRLSARLALGGGADARARLPAPVVIAYLRDDAGASAAEALARALAGIPGVREVRRVAPAEALARMRAGLGSRARLLDGAEDNLLPASLEVSLEEVAAGDLTSRARQLGARLAQIDGVSDIDVVEPPRGGAGPGRPSAPIGALRPGLLALVLLAGGAASLGLVAAGRARRRDEARLLLSLGFTRAGAFIPAVLSGLGAAAAGAALGLAALRFGWRMLPAARIAGWSFLSAGECAIALAAALALGALAGYVTVHAPDPIDAV
jgi:hypothetical protein